MARGNARPKPATGKNPDRKNGKAYKKNPKENANFISGKTNAGYVEQALERRVARRMSLSPDAPVFTQGSSRSKKKK